MTDFPTRIRLDEIYPAETNRGRRLLEAIGAMFVAGLICVALWLGCLWVAAVQS